MLQGPELEIFSHCPISRFLYPILPSPLTSFLHLIFFQKSSASNDIGFLWVLFILFNYLLGKFSSAYKENYMISYHL